MTRLRLLYAVAFFILSTAGGRAEEVSSGHRLQELELQGVEQPEWVQPLAMPATAGEAGTPASDPVPATNAVQPTIKPSFINFGYMQNNEIVPYIRWESLTHVGPAFLDFDANGNFVTLPSTSGKLEDFRNRPADLRAGGAAQRAGVKVIAVVRNAGFNETTLASVMTNASRRTQLVNNVINLVMNDTYCQGVSFDFEFSWPATTRDGITQFLTEMRAQLPADKEITIYTHAIFNSTYWNIPAVTPLIDYMLYSTYDWGTGNAAHAPSDYNNLPQYYQAYLDAGLPPEKLVLVWASYGRRWENVSAYNGSNTSEEAESSRGFWDGLYETTLGTSNGGPHPSNYVVGDEIGWYTYQIGGVPYTTVWETPESLELKINAALSMPWRGTADIHDGKRLGGVGWWSLRWMSNATRGWDSRDPITNTTSDHRPRTYPHIYQLCQELLAVPGREEMVAEGFEGNNDRWRDPNESPDTSGDTDGDSAVTLITAPAGAGRPASTSRAARVMFDFEAASNNRLFYRHEILRDSVNTGVVDVHAALVNVSANTEFKASINTPAAYVGRQVRMALMDGSRQMEVSPPFTLNQAGWRTLSWKLNDTAVDQVLAFNTNEPALLDGNGVLDTAGPMAEDIRFLGFLIEGGAAGTGIVYFDEITYQTSAPGGREYQINEFRYSVDNQEFVEISGPAGPFPADMQLRVFGSSATPLSTVNLGSFAIPASGVFVIGDPGVAGASGLTGTTPAGWNSADNLPAVNPSGLQLYGTTSGFAYDNVLYRAYNGINDLGRAQTAGLSREGYGWLGDAATGTDAAGASHTFGRRSDGLDSQVNQWDFSLMQATPGAPNGNPLSVGSTFDFETVPAGLFQTFKTPVTVSPVAALIPASPSGGRAYRLVDTSGGGVTGFIGSPNLGETGGLDVTGQLYIPAGAAQPQAIAVGFCGTQGSTFFETATSPRGYEDGYWLIYEHGTIALNDGQPSHAGQFQFIHATNDKSDDIISTALGTNKTLAAVAGGANAWVNFRLRIDPTAAAGQQLIAQVNNIDVYRGPIPVGGPTKGMVQFGFRETNNTVPLSEGTWVDNLLIQAANGSSSVADFQLY